MDTLFPVQAALFMHNLLKLSFLRRKSSSYLISPVGVEPSKWQKDNVESISTCLHLFSAQTDAGSPLTKEKYVNLQ
jgi:hypothetical protein